MNRHQRILIELLAPCGLATLLVLVHSSDTLLDLLLGLLPFLGAAYGIGIVPSLLYMALMELWFRQGFYSRFGVAATLAYSSLLGCGAGWLLQSLISGLASMPLARVGALVGLLIAIYVTSHERYVGLSNTY